MPTKRQVLGRFGELCVVKECACPKCKRRQTLKRLPNNFKCADVICDFCGYLGQVKAITVNNIEEIPATVLGAAWSPQKERMEAAIYFPLFLVWFLVSDIQSFISQPICKPSKCLNRELRFRIMRGGQVGKVLSTTFPLIQDSLLS